MMECSGVISNLGCLATESPSNTRSPTRERVSCRVVSGLICTVRNHVHCAVHVLNERLLICIKRQGTIITWVHSSLFLELHYIFYLLAPTLRKQIVNWKDEGKVNEFRKQSQCMQPQPLVIRYSVWPSFATELEKIETLQICFPDFKITYVPRVRNLFADFLAKTARTFRRELLFIGCSIPVWLPRPLQA
ncbi:hypothetical protein YC2023_114256 [Brassica napus]